MNIITTTEAGKVLRAIGVDGSLQILAHYTDIELSPGEALFFLQDGEQVPYFIRTVEQQDEQLFVVTLDELDNKEQVRSFVQHPFWMLSGKTGSKVEEEESLNGWIVYDHTGKEIGEVLFTADMGSYLLLTVMFHEKEVLIPLHEDMIHEMDQENQRLVMELPDGILDLED